MMMIIFAAVGVVIVAAAVFFFATNLGNRDDASDTFLTYDVIPLPTEPTPPGEPPPPRRWDDAFLEDNVFILPDSLLTGLPIHEENLNRRPVAVVINNIHRALPQSGIASADIIYESLSEGDVTRLIGIFQSALPEMIGPVRSARDYFVDFAFNHDALFVHHGASPSGYTRIRGQRIDHVDGMTWEGRVFWRDRTYPYWARNTGTRPVEHSSFTGGERITQHIDEQDIRDVLGENPAFGFVFGEVPGDYDGIADRIEVPFSPNYVRTFVFNPMTGLYYVYNRDGAHVDALNQQQVTVTNVLIQLTTKRVVDAEGRRDVDTIGSGVGYLATSGTYRPVRWEKTSHADPMRWYFEDGEPLVLPPGRIWVCVFQSNGAVLFEEMDVEEAVTEE